MKTRKSEVSYWIFEHNRRCSDSPPVLDSEWVTEWSQCKPTFSERQCSFIRALVHHMDKGHRINGLASSFQYDELLWAASGCRHTAMSEDFVALCKWAETHNLIQPGPTHIGQLPYRILGITVQARIFAAKCIHN